jgi:hypothetical protein
MVVAVNDIVRITAKMKWFGTDDVVNVFTYKVDQQDLLTDLLFMTDVSEALSLAYAELVDEQSDSFTYESVDGFNITQDILLPDVAWNIITAGTSATNIVPQQLAISAFWPTTRPKTRSQAFFSGFVVGMIDTEGEVTAGGQTAVQDAADIITRLTTPDIDLVKGSWNSTLSLFTPSGAAQVPARWRTQRRRRIGVGS